MEQNTIKSVITFLPCKSIEEMHKFYGDLLGLKLYIDQGQCRIYESPRGYVGFCNHYEAKDPVGVVCFVVDSKDEVDYYYNRMAEQDIITEGTPMDRPEYGIYQYYAKDPSGNRVEVQCFLD